jgi:DNA repair exonuclease SbcCD nuclease subunit
MKIVHISDSHLGKKAFSKIDPISGLNLREKQIYDNFNKTIKEIIEINPDVVIHSGDLFDSSRPKLEALDCAMKAFATLYSEGIPIMFASGNHDNPKDYRKINPIQFLDPESYGRFAHAESVFDNWGISKFYLVPNQQKSEDYISESNEIIRKSQHYMNLFSVLVTHGLVPGFVPTHAVNESEIPIEIFDGFDYVALGHVHHQCKVSENAWYAGSLEYLNYGEINDTKGGLLVELNEGQDMRVSHIDLPHTPMYDCGAIDCRICSPEDILQQVIRATADLPEEQDSFMAKLTLVGCKVEVMAAVTNDESVRKMIDRALDFRVELKTVDKGGSEHCIDYDLDELDILKEFAAFSEKNHQPSDSEIEEIVEAGTGVLRIYVEDVE